MSLVLKRLDVVYIKSKFLRGGGEKKKKKKNKNHYVRRPKKTSLKKRKNLYLKNTAAADK